MPSHAEYTALAEKVAALSTGMAGYAELFRHHSESQQRRDDEHRKNVAEALNRMQSEFDRLGSRIERSEERHSTALRLAIEPILEQIRAMQAQVLTLQQQSASRGGQERLVAPIGAAVVSALVAAIVAYLSQRG